MSEKQRIENFFTPKKAPESVPAGPKKKSKVSLYCFVVLGTALLTTGGYFAGSAMIDLIKRLEVKETQMAAKEAAKKQLETIKVQKQQAILSDISYNALKNMTEPQLTGFIQYLKFHQDIYDSRINLISDTLIAAEQAQYKGSLPATQISQSNKDKLIEYKKGYEKTINDIQTIYVEVHSGNSYLVRPEANDIMNYYNNYKANLLMRNTALEKVISEYTYPNTLYNMKYNTEHGVIVKMRDLEKQVDESMSSFSTNRRAAP